MGKPKDPSTYTIVGKPVPRADLPPKILGHFKYVTDVRVPGMLHGRVIRPSGVGATFVSVDETPAKAIPGFVKTVVKGNFVGVVAENEWAAIQAAKAVKVTWTAPKQAFPEQKDLYAYMRSAPPKASKETLKRGDAAAALSNAAKKVEASYEFPFQSHATMGPGCAVADVHTDGITTVWSGGQKPHDLQKGFAELLRVPVDTVRVVWVEDAGSYGRPGFEDAAADAVLLSEAVGKPVRVQWMREDMTAWGTKGPAVVCDLAAALDAQGEATSVQFTSRAFSGGETHFRPGDAGNYLGAQLTGIPNTTGVDEFAQWGVESPPYTFQNILATAHVIPAFYDSASPLRTTHLRDPEGPATSFAVESFMDEIAAAAGADPIEFRLKHLDDPRAKAVLTAAAQKAGWDTRPSPKKGRGWRRHCHGPRRRAQHAQRHVRRDGRRSGSQSQDRSGSRDALRLRARLRADHQSRSAADHDRGQPDPIARPQPEGRSDVRPQQRDQRGLDHVSRRASIRRSRSRGDRADQSSRTSIERRWRAVQPRHRRGHRQRDLRCHRRARPPSAAHAGARQSRTGRDSFRVANQVAQASACGFPNVFPPLGPQAKERVLHLAFQQACG